MIILPPPQVFKYPKVNPASIPELHGKAVSDWVQTVALSSEGTVSLHMGVNLELQSGIYFFSQWMMYPRKGHPYPDAIYANNLVKRIFLALVMPLANPAIFLPACGFLLIPWKYKLQIIEKYLLHFCRASQYILKPHLLEKCYYNNCSRELWQVSQTFLTTLGISEAIAQDTGEILATLIEYDDAYRYPLEDVLSETSKEQLLQHPRKELRKLMQIFRERSLTGEVHTGGKFIALIRLLSFVLLIPKIRRAFRAALSQSQFANLQLDDLDRAYCINRTEYKYFGYEIQERLYKYIESKSL